MNIVKDGDNYGTKMDAELIVAYASAGVLAILAVASVIVCCKHHSDSEVEEEEEGEEN